MLLRIFDVNALFDKKLSQEEAWIRQGVKARRTRNEGRVRALEALREVRRQRLNRTGKVELKLEEGKQSGQLVFEAEHGVVTSVLKIRRRLPVEDYLKPQKRFAHLFGKRPAVETIARIQAIADGNIRKYHLFDEEVL